MDGVINPRKTRLSTKTLSPSQPGRTDVVPATHPRSPGAPLSDRNIDSEATREVATTDVPALADAYEQLERLIVDAGGYLDSTGVSEEMSTDFIDYHLLLRNAVVESRQNYEDLGSALEQIADDDERTEGEIAAALGTLAGETEGAFNSEGYTTMAEGQYVDSLTEAPSEFDKHLAPETETRGDGVAL